MYMCSNKVVNYLSFGFQSKESKPQLSLWSEVMVRSEVVVKGLVASFSKDYGGDANVPFVLILKANHRK